MIWDHVGPFCLEATTDRNCRRLRRMLTGVEVQDNKDDLESRQTLRVVIDHLSGFHRGSRQILSDDDLEIGTARDATIHFPADHEPGIASHHARITRRNGVFELLSIETAPIRVNGILVDAHILSSGDLIVVGEHGPVIRFRTFVDPKKRFKSIPEALADCIDYARAERSSLPGRTWAFLKRAPHEMLQQTAPWTRILLFTVVTVLLITTLYLGFATLRFQRDLAFQAAALTMVQEDRGAMTDSELEELRAALESQLSATLERVEALETMTEAGRRLVGNSSASIAFLVGEFGFTDEEGNVLRTVVDANGRQLLNRFGNPAVGTDGNGPPVSNEFTGTGFVVTETGLLLTNRHVVLPWEFDVGARTLINAGFRPVMNRFVGYLPGVTEAFRVSIAVASDSVDLALLQCEESHEHAAPLNLSDTGASPGDEVYLMGYPTGIRALLARTDARFVNRLMEETKRDLWTIAERLASEKRIAPLATSGIVGQVTSNYVVYDAETTHGGSGGPVIGLDGRVVAVNTAILNDFGGSNLGIPVERARQLLLEAATATEP